MRLFEKLKHSGIGSTMLLIWVLTACLLPNVWLSFTERMPLFATLTNVILPAGIYALLMSVTPKVGKASLWMIILFFFAAFQIVLLYMYGRSVIAVDMFLNVVTTNPGEVNELLGNMLVILLFMTLIYIPPIVLGIMAVCKKWRLGQRIIRTVRNTGLWLTVIGMLLFGLSFTSARPYRPLCDLYPVNVIYNLYLAVQRTVKTSGYHETSADYRFNAVSEHADSIKELYVVVVGETSRADNWQLMGYDRANTPHLMDVSGLTAYQKALSQSNTTHKSVPMLLSELNADNFADSIYRVKSLITAFKEAGYHTSFISNQSRNHSFIDFFGEEADTCIFIKDNTSSESGYSYDTDMLTYLDKAMDLGHGKTLVVLHAYGSHFNYIDRYPNGFGSFLPDRPASATHHYRQKQINAYDNTVEYTSMFLRSIIDRLEKFDGLTGMIYTSDHGEDIFDDDRHLFLHASPIPSYYQIHVPMLVWLGHSYRESYPSVSQAAESNKDRFVATSRAFFHSILDMAGISTPVADRTESILSPLYTPRSPMYLNDHNESVPLFDCGILHYDKDKLRTLGIV